MMNHTIRSFARRCFVTCAAIAVLAWANPGSGDTYEIDWHTIDCGGAKNSSGGGFELSGTIGQSDAGPTSGPMTGGGFSLEGGFWPGAGIVCPLPGDMNNDGLRNGKDIQGFVNCLVGIGACLCADTDVSGAANVADIPSFVNLLTS